MNTTARTRTHNRRFLLVAVAFVMVGGACKGPVAPLDVGSKDVALDMLIGAKRAVAGAPLPPVMFPTDADGRISRKLTTLTELEYVDPPPLPPRPPRTTLPPGVCPTGDPRSVPKKVAPNGSVFAPAAQKLEYRTDADLDFNGHVTKLPKVATVEILNPFTDMSKFPLIESTWQVAVTLGSVTTTTSYRSTVVGTEVPREVQVSPEAEYRENVDEQAGGGRRIQDEGGPQTTTPKTGLDAPSYPKEGEEKVDENARPNRGVPPGLYITKIESSAGVAPFQPAGQGLLVAKWPLTIGDSFDTVGTDGATTMSFRSTVLGKETVDACGTPLDSWTILLNGRIVTADKVQNLAFTSVYQLGTQYGNIILSDYSTVTGTELATGFIRRVWMDINREPAGGK